MTSLPIPVSVSEKLATSALQNARSYMGVRGWSSGQRLEIVARSGEVGIKSSVRHLIYQELGTRPRLMTELEGRRIPIGDRVVTVKGVGKPGFVTLPGGVKRWRKEKWRHPGIKPTHFMRGAIEKSLVENRQYIQRAVMEAFRE